MGETMLEKYNEIEKLFNEKHLLYKSEAVVGLTFVAVKVTYRDWVVEGTFWEDVAKGKKRWKLRVYNTKQREEMKTYEKEFRKLEDILKEKLKDKGTPKMFRAELETAVCKTFW